MNKTPGTEGYEKVIKAFAESSFSLDFDQVNKDFLAFLPTATSPVLDLGSGVGQNSAALAQRGYSVVAIEPLEAFLQLAQQTHKHPNITWIQDSLPDLGTLNKNDTFSFILIDGVWQHIRPEDREHSIQRLSSLLHPGGICAISLRHGPAGAGTYSFPNSCDELIKQAKKHGLDVVLRLENQASIMPNKKNVSWSRIALKKVSEQDHSAPISWA